MISHRMYHLENMYWVVGMFLTFNEAPFLDALEIHEISARCGPPIVFF